MHSTGTSLVTTPTFHLEGEGDPQRQIVGADEGMFGNEPRSFEVTTPRRERDRGDGEGEGGGVRASTPSEMGLRCRGIPNFLL